MAQARRLRQRGWRHEFKVLVRWETNQGRGALRLRFQKFLQFVPITKLMEFKVLNCFG